MTTKEQIKQVLERWGFPILRENETSALFRYQMSYIQANIVASDDNDDCDAIALALCGVFSARNDGEMILGLRTCNELNNKLLQIKLYIDSDSDLTISAEFFNKDPEDLESQLSRSLKALVAAKKLFLHKYSEFEDEAKLISELGPG